MTGVEPAGCRAGFSASSVCTPAQLVRPGSTRERTPRQKGVPSPSPFTDGDTEAQRGAGRPSRATRGSGEEKQPGAGRPGSRWCRSAARAPGAVLPLCNAKGSPSAAATPSAGSWACPAEGALARRPAPQLPPQTPRAQRGAVAARLAGNSGARTCAVLPRGPLPRVRARVAVSRASCSTEVRLPPLHRPHGCVLSNVCKAASQPRACPWV